MKNAADQDKAVTSRYEIVNIVISERRCLRPGSPAVQRAGRRGPHSGLLDGRLNLRNTGSSVIFLSATPYLEDYLHGFKFKENDKITPVLYQRHPGGWKLDMDTGAVFTNRAYVLNVLTMKAYGFENKENGIEKIEVIQI